MLHNDPKQAAVAGWSSSCSVSASRLAADLQWAVAKNRIRSAQMLRGVIFCCLLTDDP
jgi:hypothetical protein